MASELSKDFDFQISKGMLRRFLKKLGYTWKRFRKSLKSKQDPIEYEKKLSELKQLLELYHSNYIDLFFGDASGFNLEGYVPYGWQPKREYIKVTPSKTKGTQIFGLMSLKNELESYSCKGSMNSEVVIAYLDDFKKNIKKRTIIVLDNASIHKSKKFLSKVEQWKQDDLYIWFLPKYSPHLNPIEILWRMMKYNWIPYERIMTQNELDKIIEEILLNFGSEYTINFKEHKETNIFN